MKTEQEYLELAQVAYQQYIKEHYKPGIHVDEWDKLPPILQRGWIIAIKVRYETEIIDDVKINDGWNSNLASGNWEGR